MDYKSEAKYLKISPQKLREVVEAVRDQSVEEMMTSLKFINKKGARLLQKALNSIKANIENNHAKSLEVLEIKKFEVNEGPSLKRWRAAAMGRAHQYKRRTSHIKIILTDKKEKN